jgi:adenosyl cobinamide kinase/adenosyl cobinamide phosphate guanylyltransferase
MNFEKLGFALCKIVSKDKKTKDVNIYFATHDDKNKIKYPMESIELDDQNESMQHMPYTMKDKGNTRQILYVSGASGSGKSFYASSYIKEYVKMFPKNDVYIVSSIDKDEQLDKIKNVRRIKLDEKFYETPFTIEDFRDTLVVYDDTEMIANNMIQEKITNILNLILTTGRHTNTFAINTSHVTNGGHRTKLILLESHSVTLFLATMGDKALKYFLETSFGFGKKQIDKIRNLDSRWITVCRTIPVSVIHENGIFILNKKR